MLSFPPPPTAAGRSRVLSVLLSASSVLVTWKLTPLVGILLARVKDGHGKKLAICTRKGPVRQHHWLVLAGAQLTYLKKRNKQHDSKTNARVSLQCCTPRLDARRVSPVRFGALLGGMLIGERPSSVPHRIKATAIQGILNPPDRPGIVAAEEALPKGR